MEDKKLKKVYEKINDIRMMIGGTLSAEGVTHEDVDVSRLIKHLDKFIKKPKEEQNAKLS